MSELEQKNGPNGLAKVLNQLNLPTLAMILLMGGGNFLATKTTSDEQREDIHRAVRQIDDLHDAIKDFEQRQKDELSKATISLENQNQLLRNQSMMIANQQELLKQLKTGP